MLIELMQNVDELLIGILFRGKIRPVRQPQRTDWSVPVLAGERSTLRDADDRGLSDP